MKQSVQVETHAEGADAAMLTRVGCLLADAQHVSELSGWASGYRSHALALQILSNSHQLTRGAAAARGLDVIVLDAANLEGAVEVMQSIELNARPEVIAIGIPCLDALRFRGRGVPFLIEVPGAWSLSAVAQAIERVLCARLPLRSLGRALVGCAELQDAISLLRYSMFTEALARSHSKRAAARLLGVTRPAIQQMAKGYSVCSHESEPS